MRLISNTLFLLPFILLLLTGASCKKNDRYTESGSVRFSADTLLFDTVFTSLGSATYKIKIYNNQDRTLKLSGVRLEKGTSSFFKLNVNGISGNTVADVELAPKDSLYVYSTVTIDPNSDLSPFVVEDRLIVTVGAQEFSVPVIAYGQNARYISGELNTQTWDNILPYVILSDALVDKDQTLTILAGCRVYVHPDSRLYIDGTLKIEGTKMDSVVFQSDRIDRSYFAYLNLPGEWGGLYFTENSKNNHLKWVVLKNCGASTRIGNGVVQPAAIQVDNNPGLMNPQDGLLMENCIVQNSFGYGLLTFGGKVSVRNCLINTCGSQNVGVFQGGNIELLQSTFVTYGTRFVSHSEYPVMSLLNYLDTSQRGFIPGNLKAVVRNCIIYGSLKDELICNAKNAGVTLFDVTFDHCLIKAESVHPSVNFILPIFNADPLFKNKETWDYHLEDGSPARGAGALPFVGNNLDDISGTGNIGAY